MRNHGNFVGSLGNLCRWLGERARRRASRSIRAFPPPTQRDDDGTVIGVVTGDMGVGRDGEAKDTFTPGIELCGR